MDRQFEELEQVSSVTRRPFVDDEDAAEREFEGRLPPPVDRQTPASGIRWLSSFFSGHP